MWNRSTDFTPCQSEGRYYEYDHKEGLVHVKDIENILNTRVLYSASLLLYCEESTF